MFYAAAVYMESEFCEENDHLLYGLILDPWSPEHMAGVRKSEELHILLLHRLVLACENRRLDVDGGVLSPTFKRQNARRIPFYCFFSFGRHFQDAHHRLIIPLSISATGRYPRYSNVWFSISVSKIIVAVVSSLPFHKT